MSFQQKKSFIVHLHPKSVKKKNFMACKLHAMKNFRLLIINMLIILFLKTIAGSRYFILRFPAIAKAKLMK
jgi:hypothetical protein